MGDSKPNVKGINMKRALWLLLVVGALAVSGSGCKKKDKAPAKVEKTAKVKKVKAPRVKKAKKVKKAAKVKAPKVAEPAKVM